MPKELNSAKMAIDFPLPISEPTRTCPDCGGICWLKEEIPAYQCSDCGCIEYY